jgi:hypothetical protein
MDVTADEIAGVVDLFGGLTQAELARALSELAFRHGDETEPEAFETAIDEAVQSYHLVRLDATAMVDDETVDDPRFVPGPVAFPELPEDARDLPHILSISERSIDVEQASEAVAKRFRTDAQAALDAGDQSRIETLVDVSYELEAWGGLDLSTIRSELVEES